MNAKKISDIQQKISEMQYVERQSTDGVEKFFGEPISIENKIRAESSEIEGERQKINRAVSNVKNNFGQLEIIAFPESMPESAINILEMQAQMIRQIDAKQNEIHKKFLQYRQEESSEKFVSD